MEAANEGDVEGVKNFIHQAKEQTPYGWTALMHAAWHTHFAYPEEALEIIQLLQTEHGI